MDWDDYINNKFFSYKGLHKQDFEEKYEKIIDDIIFKNKYEIAKCKTENDIRILHDELSENYVLDGKQHRFVYVMLRTTKIDSKSKWSEGKSFLKIFSKYVIDKWKLDYVCYGLSQMCICSHHIQKNFMIKNPITGAILPVGRDCILKFSGERSILRRDIILASKNKLCKTCNIYRIPHYSSDIECKECIEKKLKINNRLCKSCNLYLIPKTQDVYITKCKKCYYKHKKDQKEQREKKLNEIEIIKRRPSIKSDDEDTYIIEFKQKYGDKYIESNDYYWYMKLKNYAIKTRHETLSRLQNDLKKIIKYK